MLLTSLSVTETLPILSHGNTTTVGYKQPTDSALVQWIRIVDKHLSLYIGQQIECKKHVPVMKFSIGPV